MFTGKANVSMGFLFLALFMIYGFVLIFPRDFAPGKEQWIADYGVGMHFDARLAHVHGNLFALLNVVIGLVLMRVPGSPAARWISGLAFLGMLMLLGILAEVLFGAPPALAIVGGISMVIATAWTAAAIWRTEVVH